MANPLAAIPPLDDTFGAILIGTFVATALWGVTCTQTFMYFNNYQTDSNITKGLVVLTWLLDTIHQALCCHVCYVYLVTNYANPAHLVAIAVSLPLQVVFAELVGLLVRGFFTVRIWRLTERNWIISGVVAAFVISEFVVIMIYTGRAFTFTTLLQLPALRSLSIATNALSAAGDVVIAFFLCWTLQSSRTGFMKSNTIITKLIMFSINTGLATSLVAIGSLIGILRDPNGFIYIAFYFTLSRVYSNSLLATLNARAALRKASDGRSMPSLSGTHSGTFGGTTYGSAPIVKVDRSQHVDYDPAYQSYELASKKKEFGSSRAEVSLNV